MDISSKMVTNYRSESFGSFVPDSVELKKQLKPGNSLFMITFDFLSVKSYKEYKLITYLESTDCLQGLFAFEKNGQMIEKQYSLHLFTENAAGGVFLDEASAQNFVAANLGIPSVTY
jgi:hypothetical protein